MATMLKGRTTLRDFLSAPLSRPNFEDAEEARPKKAKSSLAVGSWKDWSQRKQRIVKSVIMLRLLEQCVNSNMRDTQSTIGMFLHMNEHLTHTRHQVGRRRSSARRVRFARARARRS